MNTSTQRQESVAPGLSFAAHRERSFGFVEERPSILRRRHTGILVLLFLLSLPLVNPWVRGDGVGYYAYIRSMLVEHKLDFQNDWRDANLEFHPRQGSRKTARSMQPSSRRTGHLDNHFSVGPSILWAPFLVPLHLGMLALQKLGFNVRAGRIFATLHRHDGAGHGSIRFSRSVAVVSTGVSLREERWALLATLGIWFASSLPVYMYFNPSWSHAHSVFMVAVFLWYWHETRPDAHVAAVGDSWA